MNKKKILFCKLIASGVYTGVSAVQFVWGDEFKEPQEQADYLLANKKIDKRINQEADGIIKTSEADGRYIKHKLVSMIERAGNSDPVLYDPNVMRYALDMLNKMNGFYEKDNQQKQDVQLTMQF